MRTNQKKKHYSSSKILSLKLNEEDGQELKFCLMQVKNFFTKPNPHLLRLDDSIVQHCGKTKILIRQSSAVW